MILNSHVNVAAMYFSCIRRFIVRMVGKTFFNLSTNFFYWRSLYLEYQQVQPLLNVFLARLVAFWKNEDNH